MRDESSGGGRLGTPCAPRRRAAAPRPVRPALPLSGALRVDPAGAAARCARRRRRRRGGADRGPRPARPAVVRRAGNEPALLDQPRPHVETPRLPELSVVAGVAREEAIRGRQASAGDQAAERPLVGGRKLAGILAEARDERVVLGIGINVNVAARGSPAGASTGSRRRSSRSSGAPVDRAALLAAVLLALERALRRLGRGQRSLTRRPTLPRRSWA